MKLLICDDDISTVDVIQNQLNCQELGITKILRAYNGEAAKNIIMEEKPELILCDIGMPKCNGIEVLRYIREQGNEAQFAFLTCYESFEFAREAIRYGVSNYLSKPIDFEELNLALHRMIQAARAKVHPRKVTENPNLLDSRINDVLRQINNGFLGTNRERINAILRRNRMSFDADSKWRVVCSLADMTAALKEGWQRELLVFSFTRIVEEVLTDHVGLAYTLASLSDRFVYTTCYIPEENCTEKELVQKCRKLAQLCEYNISVTPTSIVGEAIPLWQSYDVIPVMDARCKKLRLQAGAVYLLKETENLEESVHSFLDDQQVILLIKTRNKEQFTQMLRTVLDKITHIRGGDSDSMIAMLHHDLRQVFNSCLKDNHLSLRNVLEDETMRKLDKNATRSSEDMLLFAQGLYDRTLDKLQELADSTDIIANVRKYIQENFREDIDRDTIAAMAYITPNYLSKRFRTEMGLNLREYINQLRIEEAKRLLLSTNDSISEISSKVGYANISYFSTVFRKQCGISPIDWRSQMTKGGPLDGEQV